MKHTGFALTLLLLPMPAMAAEPLGTITARINGGAAQRWYLTAGTGQTHARPVMNGLTEIALWGDATKQANSPEGALLIDFNLITLGETLSTADATLQYLVAGYAGGFLAVTDGATRVTVTRAVPADGALHLEGRFTATAAYSDQPMLQLTDDSRRVRIEGSFEAVLPEE